MTYNYTRGVDPIAEIGAMRPVGRNVLVRAILAEDAYEGPLQVITYNSTIAECFEVVAIGKACGTWAKEQGDDLPDVGQHCTVKSTACDRVSSRDQTGRYWLVPVEDIAACWSPVDERNPLLAAACERVRARNSVQAAAASATSAIEVVPR